MSDRNLTSLDRLLDEADKFLRHSAGFSTSAQREYPAAELPDAPLSATERKHAAGLMRVNHAGEVAAQALYQGQALTARLENVREKMREAAIEEQDHLAWCEKRLRELGSSPSILNPLWYSGSFAIGALAGLAGDRWSLGFVAETEQQVVEHLESHLGNLPGKDQRSRKVVSKMRDDEAEHRDTAREAGGATLPGPVRGLMRMVAGIMTRTAYRL
ncbi:MAG: 2-polyprenyl-3-methyl-6-methoxy-1,4-benzoquinone monooxygenase [Gammaproteobacteria bacterium]|nr:2-polyprenyl-3-methyl-6-methoxy-1,4-benzoquinone monooxygenase [Gammaproteobacteria bacterium]